MLKHRRIAGPNSDSGSADMSADEVMVHKEEPTTKASAGLKLGLGPETGTQPCWCESNIKLNVLP